MFKKDKKVKEGKRFGHKWGPFSVPANFLTEAGTEKGPHLWPKCLPFLTFLSFLNMLLVFYI